jgi:ankyrin repeat protein
MKAELLAYLQEGNLALFPKYLQTYLEGNYSINSSNSSGITLLIAASRRGHAPTIQLLLDKGAMPDQSDNTGMTALMHVAEQGRVKAMRCLLKAGASLHARDNTGDTALDYALHHCRKNATRLLLEKGAKITHISIRRFFQNQADMVECLTKIGMKFSDLLGYIFVYNSTLTEMPLDRLMSHLGTGDLNTFPKHLESYLEIEGNTIDDSNQNGMMLLIMAIYRDHEETIQLLLERRASFFYAWGSRGMTPLMVAACFGNVTAMDCLLKAGAYRNERTKEDETALGYALAGSRTEAIEFLVKRNAAIGDTDSLGKPEEFGEYLVACGMEISDLCEYLKDFVTDYAATGTLYKCLLNAEMRIPEDSKQKLWQENAYWFSFERQANHDGIMKKRALESGASLFEVTILDLNIIKLVSVYLYKDKVLLDDFYEGAKNPVRARAIIYSNVYESKTNRESTSVVDKAKSSWCACLRRSKG